jgi:hypothetical protein
LAGAGVEPLAVQFGQPRFGVERVHLADAAVHEELDDALHPGAVVDAAIEVGARLRPDVPGTGSEQALLAQQVRRGDATQAAAGVPEELTAREEGGRETVCGHPWTRLP